MALRGQGATLKYTYNGGTQTAVPLCTMITAPKVDFPELDFTNLDTTGDYKEYIPAMADGGEVSFECIYSETTLTALNTIKGKLKVGTDTTSWVITGPETTSPVTITFDGYLKSLEMVAFQANEVSKIKGTVKVCGNVTIA